MTNTPAQAVAQARAFAKSGQRFNHLCLKHVRTDLAVPSKYGSAAIAWANIPKAHRHTGQAPAGYPEWYDLSYFGHVTLSNGHGMSWSNTTGGRIMLMRRDYFGGYRGWSTQINGVNLTPISKNPVFDGPYHPGTSGPIITEVQHRLRVHATGIYDPATVAAVVAYKSRHPYLNREGPSKDIGPQTYASIIKLPLP